MRRDGSFGGLWYAAIGNLIILAHSLYHAYTIENFRLAQFPVLLSIFIGVVIFCLTMFNDHTCKITVMLAVQGLCFALGAFLSHLGKIDWDTGAGIPSGKYAVGYARTWTKKNSQHVVVYYPINKDKDGLVPNASRPPYKLWGVGTRGDNEERLVLAWAGNPKSVRGKTYKDFTNTRIMSHVRPNFWQNSPYSLDLTKQNNVGLVPMIFNHGLMGQANKYGMLLAEFASHGYIVFSLDTHSGSNGYTEKQNGEPVLFDTSNKFMDYDTRNLQVQ